MGGEKVLIVDDNRINKKLVTFVLASNGYDVRTASNAEEALTMLDGFLPRMILMDLQLPGMDGLDLTRRIKSDPRTCDIIVVAVTAYAMKGDEQRARDAGCDAYVTKPINTRTFPQTIAALLRSAQASGGR